MRITRDFLFVDLRKKLYSLTSRFRQVSCRYVWQYMMKLNRGLSVWQKPKDLFSQILSFLWKGHNKRLRGQTIDKTVTISSWTKPNREKSVIWNWALSSRAYILTEVMKSFASVLYAVVLNSGLNMILSVSIYPYNFAVRRRITTPNTLVDKNRVHKITPFHRSRNAT